MATIAETLKKLASGWRPSVEEHDWLIPTTEPDLTAISRYLTEWSSFGLGGLEYVLERDPGNCFACGKPVTYYIYTRTPGAPREARLLGMFEHYEHRVATCCGDTVMRGSLLSGG